MGIKYAWPPICLGKESGFQWDAWSRSKLSDNGTIPFHSFILLPRPTACRNKNPLLVSNTPAAAPPTMLLSWHCIISQLRMKAILAVAHALPSARASHSIKQHHPHTRIHWTPHPKMPNCTNHFTETCCTSHSCRKQLLNKVCTPTRH